MYPEYLSAWNTTVGAVPPRFRTRVQRLPRGASTMPSTHGLDAAQPDAVQRHQRDRRDRRRTRWRNRLRLDRRPAQGRDHADARRRRRSSSRAPTACRRSSRPTASSPASFKPLDVGVQYRRWTRDRPGRLRCSTTDGQLATPATTRCWAIPRNVFGWGQRGAGRRRHRCWPPRDRRSPRRSTASAALLTTPRSASSTPRSTSRSQDPADGRQAVPARRTGSFRSARQRRDRRAGDAQAAARAEARRAPRR